MKPLRITLIVSALAGLAGCIAVPVDGGYYGSGPGYYTPAPAYYAPPAVYGPSLGISIGGGGGGRRHGYRHWR